jgi:hypothetical protein
MSAEHEHIEMFDVVKILQLPRTIELEVADGQGVVVGVSEAETAGSEDAFAVLVDGIDRTVMLWRTEIRGIGRRIDPGDLYDGSSVRVDRHGRVGDR